MADAGTCGAHVHVSETSGFVALGEAGDHRDESAAADRAVRFEDRVRVGVLFLGHELLGMRLSRQAGCRNVRYRTRHRVPPRLPRSSGRSGIPGWEEAGTRTEGPANARQTAPTDTD